jgi:negative regulator of flagellin synthesis FlgM
MQFQTMDSAPSRTRRCAAHWIKPTAKAALKTACPLRPAAPASSSAKAPGADELRLSNVAARAMAEPDFDRVKVESIKQAIQDGQYPLNPRKIAESFHAIEQMIRE